MIVDFVRWHGELWLVERICPTPIAFQTGQVWKVPEKMTGYQALRKLLARSRTVKRAKPPKDLPLLTQGIQVTIRPTDRSDAQIRNSMNISIYGAPPDLIEDFGLSS